MCAILEVNPRLAGTWWGTFSRLLIVRWTEFYVCAGAFRECGIYGSRLFSKRFMSFDSGEEKFRVLPGGAVKINEGLGCDTTSGFAGKGKKKRCKQGRHFPKAKTPKKDHDYCMVVSGESTKCTKNSNSSSRHLLMKVARYCFATTLIRTLPNELPRLPTNRLPLQYVSHR
ncbi:uncharacterized protein isoform X2 [Leptinotarsa decemlineata]|uniref:uncharacterized protein isoform X2 n=1 Tax=Leptinotarsa decemlineata TaxID=7539 RepID=UPI003D309A55